MDISLENKSKVEEQLIFYMKAKWNERKERKRQKKTHMQDKTKSLVKRGVIKLKRAIACERTSLKSVTWKFYTQNCCHNLKRPDPIGPANWAYVGLANQFTQPIGWPTGP